MSARGCPRGARAMRARGIYVSAALALLLLVAAGCAGGTQGTAQAGTQGATPVAAERQGTGDTTRELPPVGYGSLRQEDIAIKVQVGGVLMRLVPLDEGVIRLLSSDSYRALRDLVESRRADIARLAQRYGLRERNVWYVSYYGMEPEARYNPMALRLTSAGRDFRPLDVVPLSAGFGEERVRQRETQSALLLFEDGLDVTQPLTAAVDAVATDSWASTLRVIERERAVVRSRAGRRTPGTPRTP